MQMRRWARCSVVVVGLLSWFVFPGAAPKAETTRTLRAATLPWPPYVDEALPGHGPLYRLVHELAAEAGYKLDVKVRPWARGLRELEAKQLDLVFPAYWSQERARAFLFSEPITHGHLRLYARRGDDISFDGTAESLRPYRIGVVRRYVNTPLIDAVDFLRKDIADHDTQNLRKLLFGRVDAISIDPRTAMYLLETQFSRAQTAITGLAPPLGIKHLHVLFARKPGAQARVAAFNDALMRLRADGRLRAILRALNNLDTNNGVAPAQ